MEMDTLEGGGTGTENIATLNKGLLCTRLQQAVLVLKDRGYSIPREQHGKHLPVGSYSGSPIYLELGIQRKVRPAHDSREVPWSQSMPPPQKR